MTFRGYCQEKWFQYVDECWDSGVKNIDAEKYFRDNRWFLRKLYREEVGRLVRDTWRQSQNEHILPKQ